MGSTASTPCRGSRITPAQQNMNHLEYAVVFLNFTNSAVEKKSTKRILSCSIGKEMKRGMRSLHEKLAQEYREIVPSDYFASYLCYLISSHFYLLYLTIVV